MSDMQTDGIKIDEHFPKNLGRILWTDLAQMIR